MKVKSCKIIALILGVSILVFAGGANAATYINLYGASAQYNFWSNMGCSYLKSAVGCANCTGPYITSDGNSAVVVGTGCPAALSGENNTPPADGATADYLPDNTNSFTGGLNPGVPSAYVTVTGYTPAGQANEPNTIYFSYSNQASWDGIDSVNGVYDQPNLLYNNACSSVTGNNAINQNQRPVATCDNFTGGCQNAGSKSSATKYVCQVIHIGTSDVESTAFTQSSAGTLFGPLDPLDAAVTRTFTGLPAPTAAQKKGDANATYQNPTAKVKANGYQVKQPETPLAYPFALFVNPGVKSYRCNSSSPKTTMIDNACNDDTWCDNMPDAGYNAAACQGAVESGCGGLANTNAGSAGLYCTAQAIDNLSRLQVVALYSGAIADWTEFGPSFWPAKSVTLCNRHAGSGTAATLDWGIMEGNGWGAGLVQAENRATTDNPPYIYFNNGTGDMKNCLNWAHGDAFAGSDALAGADAYGGIEQDGAVGYMDADNGNVAEYVQVKYNGVSASRYTMHDGIYDDFWTVNRMYFVGLDQTLTDLVADMVLYVNNPDNINSTSVGSARSMTYGASNELNFKKKTSLSYPDTPSTPAQACKTD
ncbi:MAG TPA: hypothetical protein VEF34_06010 [Syntrophobacteraceae bacterium]|nr:hypothetical protein [Syntrophobacteraceae bacterium]